MALGRHTIDPGSFTAIRIASGAVVLALLASLERGRRARESNRSRAGWRSGFFLFAYAIAFSFAYLTLTAATGALILFAAVQATVIAGAIRSGEHPRPVEWMGIMVAVAGLVYLTLPGLSAPPPAGSALMMIAGIAWGVYTLRGRGSTAPLSDTALNFRTALPPALVVLGVFHRGIHVTTPGACYALASGTISSGIGYVIWYAALRGLTATRAAVVQLTVPVIAALGAVVFLSENISLRLVISACLILGGIGLALTRRTRVSRSANTE